MFSLDGVGVIVNAAACYILTAPSHTFSPEGFKEKCGKRRKRLHKRRVADLK